MKGTEMGLRANAAALASVLLSACGGGGGQAASTPPPSGPVLEMPPAASAPALKTTLAANYLVGVAVGPASTTDDDSTLLLKHFSSITADNALKSDTVQPSVAGNPDLPAAMNFGPADTMLAYARDHGLKMRGHTLLWYFVTPQWFFAGCDADPAGCLPDVRLRLRNYIHAVMTHVGGDVYAWDVVNEVVNPDPSATNPYRTGSWYQVYENAKNAGANVEPYDYIEDAFRYAAEARADLGLNSSNLKLMINDYGTENAAKRAHLIHIINDLRNKGVPLDGVGQQFHLRIDASVGDVTQALVDIEALGGLVNHVTELDVNVYDDPPACATSASACISNYGPTLPLAVAGRQARLYRDLFAAFKRPSVESVTTWGLADNRTWLNDLPGARHNHPLLFDAARQPKWAFWAVADPTLTLP
jgi:endo-1,4-beta-xylanase